MDEVKIEFWEDYDLFEQCENLKHRTLKDAINCWKENSNVKTLPCVHEFMGFVLKNKDEYVPNGKEILNDIYENLYENGFVEEYYYNNYMIECADKLSNEIKQNIQPIYKIYKIVKVKISKDSYDIVEEKKYEE